MVTYGRPILKHSTTRLKLTQMQNGRFMKLNGLEQAMKDNQNPLDSPITDQELYKKHQAFKFKKACRPDGILNEMLKVPSAKFQLAILKLFNL